jgi:glutathione synthase/RimK-type ligase-like ATP-grasp enzyme
MKVGIHKAWHDKVDPELEIYRQILKFNNIEFIDLDSNDQDFIEKIKSVDHFIYKWSHSSDDHQIAKTVLPVVESLGIRCFPDMATSWHYDDKIREYYLLKANGFPVTESYIFWNKKKALEWVKTVTFPLVFKLKGGSGAYNVKLIKSRNEAESIIYRIFGKGIHQDKIGILSRLKTFNYNFTKIYRYYGIKFRNYLIGKDTTRWWQIQKNYILFQKFLPNNEYDTRVAVTGDRAFAFIRYNRPNDFRASGSNNWDIDQSNIDKDFIRIAFEVSRTLKFKSMAYDFIYDENHNPSIIEISYCYGDYPEYSTGYWDTDMVWHPGRFWPQYFELVDLLQLPDLKQPEMEATSPYLKAKIR